MGKEDQRFMQRAFDLAILGRGRTSPNPIVGAVLVHNGQIIGEGYHQAYGAHHAEVNAVADVKPHNRSRIPQSTLYVSLEPCNIHRNTPPCTLLILQERIPRVVVSYLDHTPGVDGSGIKRLRDTGVEVKVGVLREKGRQLSQIRNTYVRQSRPYIILKWAQSADGIFAPIQQQQRWLTGPFSKRLVHKWRSEVDAVLVGYQTALTDNPQLNNRLYYGRQPQRIVIDHKGSLPHHLHIFDGTLPTIAITASSLTAFPEQVKVISFSSSEYSLKDALESLAQMNISAILVEGGVKTLEQFIKQGLWDEARVLIAPAYLGEGRTAPSLAQPPVQTTRVGKDHLRWHLNSLNLL